MKYPQIGLVISLLVLLCTNQLSAQSEKVEQQKDTSKIKEGWKPGIPIPIISFDQDIGFQYGVAADLYDFGKNPSVYPEYKHKFYFEWSRTTLGSGINRLYYDSEYLIPKVRLTADLSYLTEQALQFFGFNGYDAVYNSSWEDESKPDYKSRVFYRLDRKTFRVLANFQGNLLKTNDKLKWIAGFAYFDNTIGPVDIEQLNKGNDEDDKLPYVDGLYDKYVDWGIINSKEEYGNKITYLKAGLVYDSRNFEPFPSRGIWSEATLSYAPEFLGDGAFTYSKFTLMHRHYIPLKSEDLVFAYRLGYQSTLSGVVPFHMQPHIVPTFMTAATSQGLGGAKTLRGIMRNRVVGDGIALGNLELRWKFLKTHVGKSDLYFGTNAFFDAGRVMNNIYIDYEDVESKMTGNDRFEDYFDPGAEKFHYSTGLGLKIAYNENQVLSIDYGVALDDRDGKSGLYIRFNWLF